MAGLFPVTGLKSKPESNENIEFRPVSFRLVATVVFIFAVIFLEGLGLLHMLLFSQDKNGNAHGNHVMNSNFAPVLHYGTTVSYINIALNHSIAMDRVYLCLPLGLSSINVPEKLS